MKEIRLDKFLADMNIGTRTEVKKLIKKGLISVNNEIIKKSDHKINVDKDVVTYLEQQIIYEEYEYYMLNKPAGYVSATQDNVFPTVMDLIKSKKKDNLFPVGRLDKDTEGFLMITNDGNLAHTLLSPKNHVEKTYYAKVDGRVTDEDVLKFKAGIDIGEDKFTLPANLQIIKSGEISEIELTIGEGKFHQVKRMFQAVNKQVVYLKRISMGSVTLDNNLMPGEYRPLTIEELSMLKNESKNTLIPN